MPSVYDQFGIGYQGVERSQDAQNSQDFFSDS
jgi:hypothetical protein